MKSQYSWSLPRLNQIWIWGARCSGVCTYNKHSKPFWYNYFMIFTPLSLNLQLLNNHLKCHQRSWRWCFCPEAQSLGLNPSKDAGHGCLILLLVQSIFHLTGDDAQKPSFTQHFRPGTSRNGLPSKLCSLQPLLSPIHDLVPLSIHHGFRGRAHRDNPWGRI